MKSKTPQKKAKSQGLKQRHKGIYLLPNILTVSALFAGFYAIVAASQERFEHAAIAILIAIVIDGLDGRVARMLGAVSEFGAQFDSLSDMVCFGVTPALVLYSWSLSALGKRGWLIAFVYCICTALRLARFNSQIGSNNKRYFHGLATPIAASFVASILWLCVEYHIKGTDIAPEMALLALILSFLKVSTIRYRSFKDLDVTGRVPFIVIPLIVLLIVFISFSPPEILSALILSYILSGPLDFLWRYKRVFAFRKKTTKNKKK